MPLDRHQHCTPPLLSWIHVSVLHLTGPCIGIDLVEESVVVLLAPSRATTELLFKCLDASIVGKHGLVIAIGMFDFPREMVHAAERWATAVRIAAFGAHSPHKGTGAGDETDSATRLLAVIEAGVVRFLGDLPLRAVREWSVALLERGAVHHLAGRADVVLDFLVEVLLPSVEGIKSKTAAVAAKGGHLRDKKGDESLGMHFRLLVPVLVLLGRLVLSR